MLTDQFQLRTVCITMLWCGAVCKLDKYPNDDKKTRKLLIHVSLSWYPNPMSVSIIQHEMYPPKGE